MKRMRITVLLAFTLTLISQGYSNPVEISSRVSDSEIQAVSESLFALDSNKASASEVVINPQTLISNSETSAKQDRAPQPLFSRVNEGTLFSKPTYKALIALLDNYESKTGVAESVTSGEVQEQETFLKEAMRNTALGQNLYSFLNSKGYYSSWQEFLEDLKMMWFGLYSRSNGKMDSSGFEHTFAGQHSMQCRYCKFSAEQDILFKHYRLHHWQAGEIKDGKVSGFHNWVRFYLLEKNGKLNYYSHSFDGPWLSYPDVLGKQFMWDGYYKQVGSSIIGCSPEFDLAVYTLCYVTRPGKLCRLTLGGKQLNIQTYTWDKTTYGDGKKYIASAYPATP